MLEYGFRIDFSEKSLQEAQAAQEVGLYEQIGRLKMELECALRAPEKKAAAFA